MNRVENRHISPYQSDQDKIIRLILFPNMKRPEQSIINWLEKTEENPPFSLDFSALVAAQKSHRRLTNRIMDLIERSCQELSVDQIEAICSLKPDYHLAARVAGALKIPALVYNPATGKFYSNRPISRVTNAAFIECYFTTGEDSYEAIEALQAKQIQTPIHTSIVTWDLATVRAEFAALGTTTAALVKLPELRANPLFAQRYADHLTDFDQGYREKILALDTILD